MICLLTILLLLVARVSAEGILVQSDVLAPEERNMKKWIFMQETDLATVAVMKVEHSIAGVLIEAYEDVTYWPEQPTIGSLLISKEDRPVVIKLPGPNSVRLRLDDKYLSLNPSPGTLVSVDGKIRDCLKVEMKCKRETVVISFYSAPMKIFRDVMPDMPDPSKGGTSKFVWHRTIANPKFMIFTEGTNDKETTVLRREGEQDVDVNRPLAFDSPTKSSQ